MAQSRSLLLVAAVAPIVGCQPKPPLPDVQERTRRVATVAPPATVQAGPYRMNFVPGKGEAVYMVWSEGSPYAMLDLLAPFTLDRPSGTAFPLRLALEEPNFGVIQGNGHAYAYPSGPKPNWNDLVDLSAPVPLDWRGDRIEVKGELQEMAERSYTAVFRTPKFKPSGAPVPEGATAVPLEVSLAGPETLRLEDGVVATIAPVKDHPEALLTTVVWDWKRVLPDVADPEPLSPTIRSNVGRIEWNDPEPVDDSRSSARFVLEYDSATGGVPTEMRLELKFEKRRRGYPFRLPLRLTWPKPSSPKAPAGGSRTAS